MQMAGPESDLSPSCYICKVIIVRVCRTRARLERNVHARYQSTTLPARQPSQKPGRTLTTFHAAQRDARSDRARSTPTHGRSYLYQRCTPLSSVLQMLGTGIDTVHGHQADGRYGRMSKRMHIQARRQTFQSALCPTSPSPSAAIRHPRRVLRQIPCFLASAVVVWRPSPAH